MRVAHTEMRLVPPSCRDRNAEPGAGHGSWGAAQTHRRLPGKRQEWSERPLRSSLWCIWGALWLVPRSMLRISTGYWEVIRSRSHACVCGPSKPSNMSNMKDLFWPTCPRHLTFRVPINLFALRASRPIASKGPPSRLNSMMAHFFRAANNLLFQP